MILILMMKESRMIIAIDNVEIVVSQSSDKTATLFVEMRCGKTGQKYTIY